VYLNVLFNRETKLKKISINNLSRDETIPFFGTIILALIFFVMGAIIFFKVKKSEFVFVFSIVIKW